MTTSPPIIHYGNQLGDLPSAVPVDIPTLLASRMLIQANSGGGKSHALRQLLEELFGKVPIIVLDPEGEFWTLREKFDVILVAKSGGDIEANVKTARLLARRLVELGASAVIDLYEMPLPERREFVHLFLNEMVNLPRNLWRDLIIAIDEIHQFAPERSAGEAVSTDDVIALATLGRKRGFCLLGATQRISKLHKDAMADLLNRIIGRTGMDVDVKRAGDELGFSKEERRKLVHLNAGEFYAFGPAIAKEVTLVRTAPKLKTGPPPRGSAAKNIIAPPPSAVLTKLLTKSLADLPAEAAQETATLEQAKAEIHRLNQQVKRLSSGRADPAETNNAVRIAVEDAGKRWAANAARDRAAAAAVLDSINRAFSSEMNRFRTAFEAFDVALRRAMDDPKVKAILAGAEHHETDGGRKGLTVRGGLTVHSGTADATVPTGLKSLAPARAELAAESMDEGGESVRPGEKKLLAALAAAASLGQNSLPKKTLAARCGMTPDGGTFKTYFPRLKRFGLLTEENGDASLTDAGRKIVGKVAPQTEEEIWAEWMAKLRPGERAIMAALLHRTQTSLTEEGTWVTKAKLAESAAMTVDGGTFKTYYPKLKRLGIVEEVNGKARVSPSIFPDY
jgi:hypothetical protein